MSHAVLMKHDEALKWRDIGGHSSKHTFHPLTGRQEEAWMLSKRCWWLQFKVFYWCLKYVAPTCRTQRV